MLSAIEIHNLGENIADDFGLLLYLLCVSFSVPICIFETDGSQWCCVTYTCVYWDLEFQLLGELLKEGGEKKLKGVSKFKGDLKTFFLGGTGTLTDTMNTVSFS